MNGHGKIVQIQKFRVFQQLQSSQDRGEGSVFMELANGAGRHGVHHTTFPGSGTVTLPAMFRASFAGQELVAARVALPELYATGKPVPAEAERANSFLTPLGPEPGRGWVFMRRGMLNNIDLDAPGSLVFQYEPDGGQPTTLTFPELTVAREPLCLTPSYVRTGDPTALYLVELADARLLAQGNPISKEYNVRAPFAAEDQTASQYYEDSLNGGTPWTWQTMVTDLWADAGLAGSASLPFSPHGTPEGFSFRGVPAYDALNSVLERIGCIICPAPFAGTFSIVQLGTGTLPSPTNWLIHDGDYLATYRGRVPFGYVVYFHKRNLAGPEVATGRVISQEWELPAPYSVTVASGVAGAAAGNYMPLWDDLPALYDASGALLNATDLAARAAERAADMTRMLTGGGDRLWKVYSGLVGIGPSGVIKGVAWRESSGGGVLAGVTTEMTRNPAYRLAVSDSGRWEERTPSGLFYGASHWLPSTRKDDNQYLEWIAVESLITVDFTAAASNDTFTATGHGLLDDDEVMLIDPTAPDTLPGGVVAGTSFYVIRLTADTFKLAASPGGSAIDISSDGIGSFVRTFNGYLYWPGKRVNFVPSERDFLEAEEIWCVSPGKYIPKVGKEYMGRRVARDGPSDDLRALYTMDIPDCCQGPDPFESAGGGTITFSCVPCDGTPAADLPVAWDMTFPSLSASSVHNCTGCDIYNGRSIRLSRIGGDVDSQPCTWKWTGPRGCPPGDDGTGCEEVILTWAAASSATFGCATGSTCWLLSINLGFLTDCDHFDAGVTAGVYFAYLEPTAEFDCVGSNTFQLKGPFPGDGTLGYTDEVSCNDIHGDPVEFYSEDGGYWASPWAGSCPDFCDLCGSSGGAPCHMSGTITLTPVFA